MTSITLLPRGRARAALHGAGASLAGWLAQLRRLLGVLLAAVAVVSRTTLARLRTVGDLNDVLHIAGAACLSTGAGMVYTPAGVLTAGVLLLAAGMLGVGDRSE